MPKFFIKTENLKENEEIWITGRDVNHIKNVLRKKIDDKINICNSDTQKNYECVIKNIEENKIVCKILYEVKSLAESNINITIFQGLPKADKMELIIQKATELGVKTIVPVITKRTVIKLKDKDKQNKVDRWQKIAEVAAKQSGRDIIPTIENIINIANIKFDEFDKIFVLYENEEKISIKDEIEQLKNDNKEELNIGIVIGPEGGFAENEIEQLRLNQNVSVVTLGKRILRTETVALVVSGILMYELGDLN
ncbi:MAG: 16S rRNA (uracil(1498)-N(3))-methyltransferase [Clostridium sp.]|nr:16S rRNA (uracil(1498)-N(3))-methyltransferase [Clostridium sp.]